MPHQLIIDLPDNAVIPPHLEQEQHLMRDAITVVLYSKGKLTLQEACELMGLTRKEFEELLPEYGIAMMDETMLLDELNARKTYFAVAGLPDAVADGRSGFLVAADDYAALAQQIVSCLQPEQQRISAEDCIAHAKKFSWTEFNRKLSGVINQLI